MIFGNCYLTEKWTFLEIITSKRTKEGGTLAAEEMFIRSGDNFPGNTEIFKCSFFGYILWFEKKVKEFQKIM